MASRGEERAYTEYKESGISFNLVDPTKLIKDPKKLVEHRSTHNSSDTQMGNLVATKINSGGNISLSSKQNSAIIGSELNNETGTLNIHAVEGSAAIALR